MTYFYFFQIARNFLKQKERTDDLNKLLTIEDNWDFDYISYQITKKGKFKIYVSLQVLISIV